MTKEIKNNKLIKISPVFKSSLEYRARGEDVRRLQQLLNFDPDTMVAKSGEGSPGKETDYYGSLTVKAVIKFQLKHNIIPDPKAPGSGRVGPKTRDAFRRVFGAIGPAQAMPSKLSKSLLEDRDRVAEIAGVYGLDVAGVLAVAEVESAGRSGFQKTGLLTVLFEAHIFYAELKKAGLNPDVLITKHPNIISATWNRKLYKGGDHENVRLAEAIKIHERARECDSYGMFQIMGFNHKVCGFNTVKEFVESLETGQEAHLDAFLKFVDANPQRMKALKAKDWATFARLYNGPRYAENQYDTNLARAYEKHNKMA